MPVSKKRLSFCVKKNQNSEVAMHSIFICCLLLASVAFAAEKYYYDGEKKVSLKPLESLVRSQSSLEFYELESGAKVGVGSGILVWFETLENKEDYLKEFGLSVAKQMGAKLHLLRVSDKSKTIETANALHQKEDIRFAHPDFYHTRELR